MSVRFKKRLILICAVFVGVSYHLSADVNPETTSQEPVEADVHEFMEYAFEPFFESLKDSLASEPKDRKAWKAVKANSLILAENGNLLMLRGPKEHSKKWNELSAAMRDQGKHVYRGGKKRDYQSTRKAFVSFVAKCNACHEAFADGEHMQSAD